MYGMYDGWTAPHLDEGAKIQVTDESSKITVNCVLEPGAKIPEYAHSNDTGADLFANEDVAIKPNQIMAVPTGVKVSLPQGYGGFILEKSGLALKGVQVMGGVIDSGYRGEIKVIIRNIHEHWLFLQKGQKVAQLEVRPVLQANFVTVDSLDQTARSEGGFGSTGL